MITQTACRLTINNNENTRDLSLPETNLKQLSAIQVGETLTAPYALFFKVQFMCKDCGKDPSEGALLLKYRFIDICNPSSRGDYITNSSATVLKALDFSCGKNRQKSH